MATQCLDYKTAFEILISEMYVAIRHRRLSEPEVNAIGSIMSVLKYLPCSLLIIISPLCKSMIYLDIFKPIPLLLTPEMSKVNSSILLIFFSFSRDVPTPLSCTVILKLSSE